MDSSIQENSFDHMKRSMSAFK
uniref:Uncharacterized protein n=1 Tax=Lepeophtheirus salmonis TaxID=72036 RepID=A0A0K2V825_LEPSM